MCIPKPILDFRKKSCFNCNCNIDFSNPCAECPEKKWNKFFCHKDDLPSVSAMTSSAIRGTIKWIQKKSPITSKEELNKRLQACKSCDLWDSSGFGGTGRCKKCGCSTWAKLRMATERCPIGKWEAVQPPEPSEATRQLPSA